MKKELRDLYDRNGFFTETTYYKGESIPDGYYPIIRNNELNQG